MDIRNVTEQDATSCAQLIQMLNKAYFDKMTAQDAQAVVAVKQWVSKLAGVMATDLRSRSAPAVTDKPADTGFKVKAMGPLGTPAKRKKK